jgi:hypothetical protein
VAAAAEALGRQGFVTPVDVCLGLGWLHASNVDDWRHGRADDLEDFLPVHGDKITELIVCLDSWARERGLERTEAEYISATPNRRPLRFSSGAPAVVEAAWRTRWVSRDLPAQKRERITKAQDSPPDLVVVQPVRTGHARSARAPATCSSWTTQARCAWPALTWTIWSSCRRGRPR